MGNSNLTQNLRLEKDKIQPNLFTKLIITLVPKPSKSLPRRKIT